MAKNLIFDQDEIAFLSELGRQRVDFIIVGLAAAALQGAPVVTQDVDLWFRDLDDEGIVKAVRKVGGAYVPPIALHPPMFAGKAVKLFDVVVHMHGLDSFDEESKSAVVLRLGRTRVKVLPLDRIIASKKALGRQKDKIVMKVLVDALKTGRAIGRKKD